MKITKTILLATAALAIATPAFAQVDPGHPRVNEVEGRLNNQQERVEKGEANGTITPQQGARDEKRDAKIQEQIGKDEAKHGGHLTKAEQRKINREENKTSKDIKRQHEKGEHRKHRKHREHEEAK